MAQWVIPPEEDAAFVEAMEEVLELYQQPLDTSVPVVNMDEQPVTLRDDIRDPYKAVPAFAPTPANKKGKDLERYLPKRFLSVSRFLPKSTLSFIYTYLEDEKLSLTLGS